MTDNVENIIVDHLKAIRAEMAGIRNDVGDLKLYIGSSEEHRAGVRRALSILHSALQLRTDL